MFEKPEGSGLLVRFLRRCPWWFSARDGDRGGRGKVIKLIMEADWDGDGARRGGIYPFMAWYKTQLGLAIRDLRQYADSPEEEAGALAGH